jgi:hypothetical protein
MRAALAACQLGFPQVTVDGMTMTIICRRWKVRYRLPGTEEWSVTSRLDYRHRPLRSRPEALAYALHLQHADHAEVAEVIEETWERVSSVTVALPQAE